MHANQNSDIASPDIDPSYDGFITIKDLEVIEKDFMKSIHDVTSHSSTWDETKWSVPTNTDPSKSLLNVGSLNEADTSIQFDNEDFIRQETIEALGITDSINMF